MPKKVSTVTGQFSNNASEPVSTRLFSIPLAWLVILLSSLGFSSWWKYKQLAWVSKELVGYYPIVHWLHTFTMGAVVFFSAWFIWNAVFFQIVEVRDKRRILLWDSFSYLAWVLPWLGASSKLSLAVFLGLKLVSLVWSLKEQVSQWKKGAFTHIGVFFLILIAHVQFNGIFSPLNWDNPIPALNRSEALENPVFSSLHRNYYVNAKVHDFSGYEITSWGSLPYSPFNGNSPVFGALAWAFDFPSADTESFYRLVMVFFFFWFVLGSFGFYLFVRYGLCLSLPVAVIAGLLSTLANHSLSLLAANFVLYFTGVFLCLPYALLFIRLAFRKQNFALAFLSGSALSLNLYLSRPHPEALMYGTGFWASYITFLALTNASNMAAKTRVQLALGAFLSFTLGSLSALAPGFQSVLAKELYVWGQLKAQFLPYNFSVFLGVYILAILLTFSFLLIYSATGAKKLQWKLARNSDFWFFFVWFIILFLFFLPGSDSPFIKLVTLLPFKINLSQPYRIFLYLELSFLVIILYGIEFSLKQEEARVGVYKGLCLLAAVCAVFFPQQVTRYSGSYILAGTGIFFALVFWAILSFRKKRYNYHFLFLILAVAFALVIEGSTGLKSAKLDNNPSNCRFYLLLRGLWVKTRSLAEDYPANREMLRKRLFAFEEELANTPTLVEVRAQYKTLLASVGATSVMNVSDEKFAEFVPDSTVFADNFYWKNPRCPYLKDLPGFYDPNFVVLFDKVKGRFSRIMGFTGVTMNMGIGEGLLINDATCSSDARFMWGYTPLFALYFLPGTYYENVGDYDALMLGRMKADILSNGKSRKLLNISGIDVMNVKRDDFNQVKERKDLEVIEDGDPHILVLRDLRSYGVAYVARHVEYEEPRDLSFESMRPPFASGDPLRLARYKRVVDELTDRLASLPEKHSAIVETKTPVVKTVDSGSEKDGFSIENILGNKAAFKVSCRNAPCRVVFNQSAVVGWEAYSDSTRLSIERANYAFVSVAAPQGEHLVWFEHRPFGLIWGLVVTGFSYLLASYYFFTELAKSTCFRKSAFKESIVC